MSPEAIIELRREADEGNPAAWRRLAVTAALGVGEPPSWADAHQRLGRAAALGDADAIGQLRVVEVQPAGGWLAPATRERLSTAPRISVARGLLPTAACDWLIQRARGRTQPAQTFDAKSGAALQAAARSNSAWALEFDDLDLVVLLARARIAATIGVPTGALEPIQVLHYAPGQMFDRHFDFLDPDVPGYAAEVARGGQRIATALTYLNENYQGGETDFPLAGVRFRGAPGDGLLFANVDLAAAPDRQTLHAGLAPLSGEKWLLSQWVRDRAAG